MLAVVIVAGLLFGYDQGVISGALNGIKREFSLSALLVEVVTSWVTLGALGGSLLGGYLADHYGRRRAVLIAGLLFIAGALLQALAPGVFLLVAGRLVVGFGVGVAAVAAPLYGVGACARRASRPLRLGLSARHHHRHLPRLSGQCGARRRAIHGG